MDPKTPADDTQRINELIYQAENYCLWCGGLPSGLAPQVYDDHTECECPEYDERTVSKEVPDAER